jgi:hypothetical protein
MRQKQRAALAAAFALLGILMTAKPRERSRSAASCGTLAESMRTKCLWRPPGPLGPPETDERPGAAAHPLTVY